MTQNQRPANMQAEFDYIIVGAGSAGCVLANRLSADPAITVLLIEAGGSDRNPFIHMPRGLAKIMANMDLVWPFTTRPEKWSNDVAEFWTRGRMLGGSSSVNGMVYVRGAAQDFDDLASQSSDDWNWDAIGTAYRAIEAHELGNGPDRGGDGFLRISLPEARSRLTEAIIAAGEAQGLARMEDINDPDNPPRVGYAPRTIWKGKRQSAATAFLRPALSRPNLTVETGVEIDRILFDGTLATGVIGVRSGDSIAFAARREVILSAGTLASPAILQRSGVGSKALLDGLDIPVVALSEQVGENLTEHRGVVFQWKVPDRMSDNRSFRGKGLVKSVLDYALRRKGPMAGGAYDMVAYVKSDPALDRPDVQILMAPFTFDFTAVPIAVEQHGGINLCVYPVRPKSRGHVRIETRDPSMQPQIVPGYVSSDADRDMIQTIFRVARDYVRHEPLAQYIEGETRPGPEFASEEEIEEAYLACGYTNYHACGTCRMGSDEGSVLDPMLRVRGTQGLRVVDASVFPFIPAGNTNAPIMAMAWRAADLIMRD